MTGSSWQHDPNASLSFSPHPQIPAPRTASNNSGKNIFLLLAWREISPRTRHTPKKRWGEVSKLNPDSSFAPLREAECDARHSLFSWAEAESLRHLTAKYCPLMPPPRSTIAAAFSPDGRSLASTHGDHTVKIIDCQTGSCLKVLSGHRRTPWVVRFHPLCSEILASGSLDHEVRLWDANTSDCIGSRNFYRPIASVAFHAKGELLAVASGHKLFMWHYNNRGDGSSPTMILKTRRSLRAVHFHPHGAPFLLTAEVNDIDSSDSSMTRATSPGYLQYPPPAVFLSNVHSNERLTSAAELPLMSFPCLLLPSYPRGDSRGDMQHNFGHSGSSGQLQSSLIALQPSHNSDEHNDGNLVPMETSPPAPSSSYRSTREDMINYFPNGPQNAIREPRLDAMEATEIQPVDMDSEMGFADSDPHMDDATNAVPETSGNISIGTDSVEHVPLNNLMSCWDPACLELPFMQGWLMGQSQAGPLPLNGNTNENSSKFFELNPATWTPDPSAHNSQASAPPLVPLPIINNLSGALKRSSARRRFPHPRLVSSSDPREDSSFQSGSHDRNNPQPIISRIQAELVTSLAAELPCTVKLRIWPYDVKDPCAVLNSDRCRLTIPHAVLCSEMGAHFSPCGRYLAVCVACILPHTEADPGVTMQINQEATGAATSPTRHPISAHQVIYELRIYSLEEATFGSVLVSRAIRAAHCLTSIQFSPTSEHILLAYGRRHSSLLKSIVIDGETSVPIYTILEVYRVSDMELVRVLPSAEDEVNVACFHPLPGCGLVYGTKEGKLRVLHYDGPLELNVTDKFCL